MKNASCTETTKTCGNCKHFQPTFTPSGRVNKKKAAQCAGVVTLVAPMAYRVTLDKMYVWFNNDAAKCPTHEAK